MFHSIHSSVFIHSSEICTREQGHMRTVAFIHSQNFNPNRFSESSSYARNNSTLIENESVFLSQIFFSHYYSSKLSSSRNDAGKKMQKTQFFPRRSLFSNRRQVRKKQQKRKTFKKTRRHNIEQNTLHLIKHTLASRNKRPPFKLTCSIFGVRSTAFPSKSF